MMVTPKDREATDVCMFAPFFARDILPGVSRAGNKRYDMLRTYFDLHPKF